MGSIIATIIGWVVGRLAGKKKESEAQEKYARASKENSELRAENTGLRVRKTVEDKEEGVQREWEDAKKKRDAATRYEILKRDFDTDD